MLRGGSLILDLDDSCWTHADVDWQRNLIELLVLVKRHESHSVLAAPNKMLPWCAQHLPLFYDYFKTRLAAAQPRFNALKIFVSPNGQTNPGNAPPWTLQAEATAHLINQPLRLVLENDETDRRFLTSIIPSFAAWCDRGWVEPSMGGGSSMGGKITAAGNDMVTSWRTFFVFDSDRLHPSEFSTGWTPPVGDSCQGHQFETLCAVLPSVRWHQLKRRSIENYLPDVVLHPLNANLTAALYSQTVGQMAHFYNMKNGLNGDGIIPPNPISTPRAARSQGLWTALPPLAQSTLELGFGRKVADEFKNVPNHYPWSAPVVAEMAALADAIQDAI
jgi:hypothetical protein